MLVLLTKERQCHHTQILGIPKLMTICCMQDHSCSPLCDFQLHELHKEYVIDLIFLLERKYEYCTHLQRDWTALAKTARQPLIITVPRNVRCFKDKSEIDNQRTNTLEIQYLCRFTDDHRGTQISFTEAELKTICYNMCILMSATSFLSQ